MNNGIIYWKIGTGAFSMIKNFINLLEKGLKITEDFRIFRDGKENWIVDFSNNKIFYLKSNSTSRQHLIVWESLGFIYKKEKNHYSIIINFQDFVELADFSKVFIKKQSNKIKIQKYRDTIMINVLVYSKKFTKNDINNNNLRKTKGSITIQEIKSTISKFEKELANDENFIKEIRRKYD